MPSSADHGIATPFQPNNVWASSTPVGTEEELTLPTGQTCRAKKVSLEDMIISGMLADSDAITAQVSKHIDNVRSKGKKAKKNVDPQVDVKSLLADTEAFKSLTRMLNKTLPSIVISPVVKCHFTEVTVGKTTVTKTIPQDEREPGIVYTDQIDFGDKMFLFDWAAGGLASMASFRQ